MIRWIKTRFYAWRLRRDERYISGVFARYPADEAPVMLGLALAELRKGHRDNALDMAFKWVRASEEEIRYREAMR